MMQDSLVQIQGLGSYLSYFDGATSAHLHSIVHTRQTKPPVEMPMVFVPCSLLKATVYADHPERSTLEIQFNATVPGKLIFMLNFHLGRFRAAVAANSSHRKRNNVWVDGSNVSLRDSIFSLDQQSISSVSDTRKYNLTYLAEHECCDRACVKYDCSVGTETFQFNFTNPSLPSRGVNA
jgi:hypothetical protein